MTAETTDFPPRRLYRDPPVIEAVARLTWGSPIAWTLTTPGLLFDALRDDYPKEPEAQSVIQAEISQPAGSEGITAGFQLRQGPQQMVFSNADGSRLLMASPNSISVHGLPPYEGWEALSNRLFHSVGRIGLLLPKDIRAAAIGLRYINRIQIPETEVQFQDWLTIAFALPPSFPQRLSAFMDRAEVLYPDNTSKLSFTWASVESPPGTSSFIVDLDLTAENEPHATIEEAKHILSDLKHKETAAFEGLLKDRLREQFDEIV